MDGWSLVHHLAALSCYVTLSNIKNINEMTNRYLNACVCLTCSFLLLCPSDLSTALQLLSSWTACLSWAFSSAFTLRTWARASASLTHWVSCRSLCSRSSSRPASTPWWDKDKHLWKKRKPHPKYTCTRKTRETAVSLTKWKRINEELLIL